MSATLTADRTRAAKITLTFHILQRLSLSFASELFARELTGNTPTLCVTLLGNCLSPLSESVRLTHGAAATGPAGLTRGAAVA